MRTKLVAANWKMNLNWNEAMTHIAQIHQFLSENANAADVALFPPAIYLRHFFEHNAMHGPKFQLGAQDCSEHVNGAFTGELSAEMLASIGVQLCIVGHSERRLYHREESARLQLKLKRAIEMGMHPIYCCGESEEDRENENQSFVISAQLEQTLFALNPEAFAKITIAYEPIWAIGTGKTATADQAQDMHEMIRAMVQSRYGEELATRLRIIYGGSVNAANAKLLFSQPDIDGALVGGASLKIEDFGKIILAAN